MLFETICQLCKTESWRWIPEVEVTPFIQQFIRGTCQGRLLQIRHRARQIRITKTETCLLKWSLCLCFCLTSSPRAGLTAHRLPLIECDRFSHYVNWQLVLIMTCHTRSEILCDNFWSQLRKPQSLSEYQQCECVPDLSVVSFHHVMLTACAVPMCHYQYKGNTDAFFLNQCSRQAIYDWYLLHVNFYDYILYTLYSWQTRDSDTTRSWQENITSASNHSFQCR